MKEKRTLKGRLIPTAVTMLLCLAALAGLWMAGRDRQPESILTRGLVLADHGDGLEVEILSGPMEGETMEVSVRAGSVAPAVGTRTALVITDGEAKLSSGYVEYVRGKVTGVISGNVFQDAGAENAWRGDQLLAVSVLEGQYAGQEHMVDNAVGPIYNQPVAVGDRVIVAMSTNGDGSVRSVVYEYDRSVMLWVVLGVFALFTVLVGGKVGARSLLGLVITLAALLLVLLPLLLKGWPTLATTFLVCALVTVASLVLLSGWSKKTVCAVLGTLAGMALALAFAALAQKLGRIDGLRMEYAEALLQLRSSGESAVGIRGILCAGVIVSSLGAVMDVAMGLSSALTELKQVDPSLSRKALFRSGMNIAKDTVGTMTNTVVLAIFGSGMMLILYLFSLGLSTRQLLSSAYLALEVIGSIASSVGIILAVPLTVTVCTLIMGKTKTK